MATIEEVYANKIILNSVLPVIKVIVESKPGFTKSFKGKNGKIQFSANDIDGKVGTHLTITNGVFTVGLGLTEKPDLEFEFPNIPHFNGFFTGKTMKLPKIHGLHHLGLLVAILKVLLFMPKILLSAQPHEKQEDKELFVKLMFYIATSGISQLNKAGHPAVTAWTRYSPDRIVSMEVRDQPEFAAYFRVKAGRTKSGRGKYTRSKPFMTMLFDCVDSAMRIVMGVENMIEAAEKGKVVLLGPPEYGVDLANLLFLVASYTK
jgi:hypothetical protein